MRWPAVPQCTAKIDLVRLDAHGTTVDPPSCYIYSNAHQVSIHYLPSYPPRLRSSVSEIYNGWGQKCDQPLPGLTTARHHSTSQLLYAISTPASRWQATPSEISPETWAWALKRARSPPSYLGRSRVPGTSTRTTTSWGVRTLDRAFHLPV